MLSRSDKEKLVSNLTESINKAKGAFMVDFKGFNVASMTKFRNDLNKIKSQCKVVKNSIAKIALNNKPEVGDLVDKNLLDGPNAFVFIYEDPVNTAKIVADFFKKDNQSKIKQGYLSGQSLKSADILYLSSLPPKDILMSQLLSIFNAPATNFVRLCNEIPSSFVRLLVNKNGK